ncbi:hypothetical protein Bbelb_165930 [Branchiostoma belcheri]|nr:hypothetical protein Bbelb_165930 [Branchiostoma belcheri]
MHHYLLVTGGKMSDVTHQSCSRITTTDILILPSAPAPQIQQMSPRLPQGSKLKEGLQGGACSPVKRRPITGRVYGTSERGTCTITGARKATSPASPYRRVAEEPASGGPEQPVSVAMTFANKPNYVLNARSHGNPREDDTNVPEKIVLSMMDVSDSGKARPPPASLGKTRVISTKARPTRPVSAPVRRKPPPPRPSLNPPFLAYGGGDRERVTGDKRTFNVRASVRNNEEVYLSALRALRRREMQVKSALEARHRDAQRRVALSRSRTVPPPRSDTSQWRTEYQSNYQPQSAA